MIRRSVGLVPLLIAASASPVFAQSHAGHRPASAAAQPAAPLPAGCVRRGAPTGDPSRAGAPGAPVCPIGAVPERAQAATDPHAGHDMSAMGQAAPTGSGHHDLHAGHDMSTMQTSQPAPTGVQPNPHAGHDMSAMGQAAAAPAMPAGHDMSTMQSGQQSSAGSQPDPHAGHDMSAMQAGQRPATAGQPDPHAGHDMSAMGQMPPGHDMSAMAMPPNVPTSADNPGRPPEMPLPPGATRGPAHAADAFFDPAEMAAAREQLRVENGDVRTTAVILDQLEASFGDGEEGFGWDAQGWIGGDITRFWWKSEGEGAFDGDVEEAELQALYSRAIRPFFDFQAGVRQTYRPEGDRTDLVVGVQGLAPYWFEVDAAAFLSNKGELTARAEAEYDQRITNRWIVQPRAEVVFSAEDIPELGIGSGLSTLQVGARLRYEFRKEFAPYVGLEWTKSFGGTADFLEADGKNSEETRFVVGIRTWF
ncbi:MAG: copper resistance protein B [Alphaproteobacteria bacterium]|nr:copper resistance protein B [Alphaproteobacteria bacterium]MBU1525892.1 copper resistance protein B [Alphaproteobacteria bacterium]MBU2352063.1 copper resistance protein B [Alphaproteobacteria bacterium]MBU2381091.1 copper resistance protein B [Alphaproteobacteria bacterium]